MDRDLYKQRAEKISGQLDEIKRKIEDAENSKKDVYKRQGVANELAEKIEKLPIKEQKKIIKVIHTLLRCV